MVFLIVVGLIVIGLAVALTAGRTMNRTVQTNTGGVTTGPGAWAHLQYTGTTEPAIDYVQGGVLPGTHADAHAAVSPAEQGIAEIKAHDPAFDETAFLEDVQKVFLVVEQAWTDRQPLMSRQVMADGIWQQHQVKIQRYLDDHRRNVLGELAVTDLTIVSAHSDQTYDTVTVRVLAASSDYDVDDKSGRIVRGDRQVMPWREDWTFQRSSDATTKLSGTMNSHCPNCGAPLDLDLQGICKYCHQPIMGGKYDWVLARISQVP
jgi:predicted lipid-binding transport protein (Tim44 family)